MTFKIISMTSQFSVQKLSLYGINFEQMKDKSQLNLWLKYFDKWPYIIYFTARFSEHKGANTHFSNMKRKSHLERKKKPIRYKTPVSWPWTKSKHQSLSQQGTYRERRRLFWYVYVYMYGTHALSASSNSYLTFVFIRVCSLFLGQKI